MTLLFCDGFDHYNLADILNKWNSYNSSYAAIGSSYSRNTSGQGVRLSGYNTDMSLLKNLGGEHTTIIVGFAFYPVSNGISQTHRGFLRFMNPDEEDYGSVNITLVSTGAFSVYRGITLVESSEACITFGAWQYVEVKVNISNTVGTVEIKVNGTTVLDLSGIDTTLGASEYTDSIVLGGNYSGGVNWFDDLYICDTNGSINNDFLGDVTVHTLYPTADGSYTDFTPSTGTDHYALVDEAQLDGSDYNETDTDGAKDSFTMETLSTAGDILAVQTVAPTYNSGDGTANAKALCRSGATPADNEGDVATIASGATTMVSHIWEQEPTDTVDWTVAKVNAAEFGLKMGS